MAIDVNSGVLSVGRLCRKLERLPFVFGAVKIRNAYGHADASDDTSILTSGLNSGTSYGLTSDLPPLVEGGGGRGTVARSISARCPTTPKPVTSVQALAP